MVLKKKKKSGLKSALCWYQTAACWREFPIIIIMAVYSPQCYKRGPWVHFIWRSLGCKPLSQRVFSLWLEISTGATWKQVYLIFSSMCILKWEFGGGHTLEWVYTNIRNAFIDVHCLHCGSSDNLSPMLIPASNTSPCWWEKKTTVRQVRVWPEGEMDAVQAQIGTCSKPLVP